jgi:hypothetical protein
MTRPFIQKADEGANAMGAEPNKSGGGAGRNPHPSYHRTNPEVPDPASEFIPRTHGQDLCNSSYQAQAELLNAEYKCAKGIYKESSIRTAAPSRSLPYILK